MLDVDDAGDGVRAARSAAESAAAYPKTLMSKILCQFSRPSQEVPR